MQDSSEVSVTTLSLPKGGGAISGMGEALNAAGPDGMATLSLPLPLSAGRGPAPGLSLTYSSSAGNGPFGIGWQCGVTTISRRTQHGIPQYDNNDTFLSPSGEVMNIALNDQGQPDIRQDVKTLQGVTLPVSYTVTHYQPRQIQDFSKIEYWQPASGQEGRAFWLISSPDGQWHILGKKAQACLTNPQNDQQIAQWLLEETVTPTGEHVSYQYRAEDEANCDDNEKTRHPNTTAQRYLVQVNYGNVKPQTSLFILDNTPPAPEEWLFHLIFDHGERDTSLYAVPTWDTGTAQWSVRPDTFSRYEYGFEVRTRRLCQQVLMFHRTTLLAGDVGTNNTPELVGRLILDYDKNAGITTLTAARQLSHEPDGTPITLPPLELAWQRFDHEKIPAWQRFDGLDNFNPQQRYQLVDLRGEGLPGMLYQERGAWWYKAPQRQEGEDSNAVAYSKIAPLPTLPNLQENASLMDINGDGQLDWVVTASGVRGYHSQQPDGKWTHFTPINALPVEYFHPSAQFADLVGAGLSDLVLIGPKSVRLYANQRDGWRKGQDVPQSAGITLPVTGTDARKLVAFSDMLGSGQQHLVEIRANRVTCWPNLGHGRFGQPLILPGFSQPESSFNPEQLFLADIDGSGTTDLIYAQSNSLLIYLNQSGNQFDAPLTLTLPKGVQFDNTCQLQVADIQGLGVASLILTVPHMAPHHWRCDLSLTKPWLLNAMNNNRGAHHTLHYRSSAQFWLDEKLQLTKAGKSPACYLPFPMHLLWHTEIQDEISGNRLTSEVSYSHGVWDGKEREFRGFGCVRQTDITTFSHGTAPEQAAPSLSISWFATGMDEVDSQLAGEYWQGDTQAYTGFETRYTTWDNASQTDKVFTPNDTQRHWLTRALKGRLLRNEVYGLDGTDNQTIPYAISESRYQARSIPVNKETELAVWITAIENRSYHYERITSDPQLTQHIQLQQDIFGLPLQSVDIAWPRRVKPAENPYPPTLPDTLFDSSYDDQQQLLRLVRQKSRWYHLIDGENWRLGLPDAQRSDVYTYDRTKIPAEGISLEVLLKEDGLLADEKAAVYLGQQRTLYTAGQSDTPLEKPTLQALVAFSETAMLDETSLQAYKDVMEEQELNTVLTQAGYQQAARLFNTGSESQVWVARQGYTDYGDAGKFWRPQAQRNSLLTGKTTLSWDTYYCVVTQTQDAAGLTTQAHYDYRFLTPVQLTDVNDNQHIVTLDALGRVTTSRFWGTESGQTTGYSTPEEKPFTPPDSVDKALALTGALPVAQCTVYAVDSWMPSLSPSQLFGSQEQAETRWKQLRTTQVVTEDGKVYALGWKHATDSQKLTVHEASLLADIPRLPPHGLMITTDRYDSEPQQQHQQTVSFSDGFDRLLQSSVRHEFGDAWQRQEDGGLVVDANGTLVSASTNTRWAVSGRTEYDDKGQPVRTYQPYFLNDWRYVSDDSARDDLFADTHIYDPLGREYKVITAKKYLREKQYTPWFIISEDENDTASRNP
ncbi:SpvB/TcaC N-terminal domain-containing protein [Photorhabdus stackebrandtii]|uniref:Virulence protein n=1 Tax=Photorhabdus stackebrandtii TaxID=1123042 RepID=A0A7X5TLQ5_9GAMM|nr:SpvB/TcaC N-terminal domain-containing protein [Photorhabdus stackebrandtii]NHB98281.1 virulence protein [Photorhabdus stackebrandtii]